MSFILSKLLIYFIYPLTWIVILFLAGLAVGNQKHKKRFLLSAFLLLLLFTNPLLLNSFAKAWNVPKEAVSDTKRYSCVIVLGGFAGELKKGAGYFNSSADRFIQSIELYDSGRASHILMTGGSANLVDTKFKEADWVALQFKILHVPDTALLKENQSRNTLENASLSKIVLEKAGLKGPYLLVTSAFHMRRAMGIFKRAGLDVVSWPCNYMTGDPAIEIDQFTPDSGILYNWNFYIKEVIGNMVDYFKR